MQYTVHNQIIAGVTHHQYRQSNNGSLHPRVAVISHLNNFGGLARSLAEQEGYDVDRYQVAGESAHWLKMQLGKLACRVAGSMPDAVVVHVDPAVQESLLSELGEGVPIVWLSSQKTPLEAPDDIRITRPVGVSASTLAPALERLIELASRTTT